MMKNRMENISFNDLSDLKNFEEFCDLIGDLLGLKIGLVDPTLKQKNTFNRNPRINPVCRLIQSSKKGLEACLKCDNDNLKRILRTRKGFSYTCHSGLVDIAVPIFVGGNHVATILSGQFLVNTPEEEGFSVFYAKNKDLLPNAEKAKEAFFSNSHISEKKLKNMVRLLSLFAEYLSEKGGKLRTGVKVKERAEIEAVKRYVEQNFREPLSLNEAATHVSLSPSYLSSMFKKQSGYAFMDYLQRLRIEEAKRLLKTTDWDILRICLESGFRNQSHFNRAFKKATGKNPKQFRKSGAKSKL